MTLSVMSKADEKTPVISLGFFVHYYRCKASLKPSLLLHATADQGNTTEAKKGSQSWLRNG
jgi:hypothetical protein